MATAVLLFISMTGVECYIWPVLGVGAFFTLLIWLEWGRKSSVYSVLIFVFGFILIGFVMKNHFALNSVLLLYNSIAEKIGALGLRNPSLYAVDVAESAYPLYFSYLMALVASFAALVSYLVVAHRQHFYLYVYSFILLIACILGFELNLIYSVSYAFIVVLILIYNRSQQLKLSFATISASVLIIAVLSLGIALCFLPILKVTDSPYEMISSNLKYNKSTSDSYGNGQISGIDFKKTDETALKITMSEPKAMYLKGFTGSDFNGSKWQEPDYDVSYVEGELFYLLHKHGFWYYSQAASLNFIVNPTDMEGLLTVEYVNADNRYVYLPYEAKNIQTEGVIEISGDYGKRIASDINKYSLSITSSLYKKLLTLKSDNKDRLTGLAYENYTVCEKNYSEYVSEYYLKVGKNEREVLEAILKENDIDLSDIDSYDYEALIETVRDILNSRISYDEQVKVPVLNSNAVDYILNKSCKGYDKHYATVATLMFRVMGVPARYVEGYIIPSEEAVKMKSDAPYSLKGKNAHAWTEIYVEGTGWVPVEIYEEDYKTMFPDLEQILMGNCYKFNNNYLDTFFNCNYS